MAEVCLKVFVNGLDKWERGDSVSVFSNRRILCKQAEMACHVVKTMPNRDGLRPVTSLMYQFYDRMHRYKFVRASSVEAIRFDRVTNTSEVVSMPTLQAWLDRRVRHPRHRIFGFAGAECWFSGWHPVSDSVNGLWDYLEGETRLRRSYKWPFSELEKRRFLVSSLEDDLTIEEESTYIKPLYDRDTVVKARQHKIDWECSKCITTDQKLVVADETKIVDLRDDFAFAKRDVIDKAKIATVKEVSELEVLR